MADAGGIRVGYGKREFTPDLPFPLAGIVAKEERLAARVRDPLVARAVAFGDGERTAVVASADLLMIPPDLRDDVEAAVGRVTPGVAGMLLTATHTHSSVGGYWSKPSARKFLGNFRPALRERIVSAIAGAISDAVGDLAPAALTFGETTTEGLNYNRRHKDGAIDRALGVLTATRETDVVRVITFGAHPVVAAFRDNPAASADYPGELVRTFEARGEKALFVVGPVGGVNVLYPEGPMEIEAHFRLLTRLLREQTDRAIAAATPVGGTGVAFAVGETPVRVALPRLFNDERALYDSLALPLRLWVRRLGRGGLDEGTTARVPVVRVGDVVLTGFPADLGAGVALAAKERIAARGSRAGFVASQTDGYVGYVHLAPEYARFEWADAAARWMTIYENGMAFCGRDMGERLLAAFDGALGAVMVRRSG
jgi:hypothetical protein